MNMPYYIDYLKTLNAPDRIKEICLMIRTEPHDEIVRYHLKQIFDTFDFAVSKDLMDACEGDKDKLIELIIQHRHDETPRLE